VLGFTSQALIAVNVNREGGDEFYDANGFLVRPASRATAAGTTTPSPTWATAATGTSGHGT
jgi:hypothetical protein